VSRDPKDAEGDSAIEGTTGGEENKKEEPKAENPKPEAVEQVDEEMPDA
jgi:hypothetical protein